MASTLARGLTRVTAPVAEPLTLAEAKLFLRVDGSSEDSLISDMIVAVREAAEEYLRKSLMTQSWKITFDDYAPSDVCLPMGPVQSVDSVVMIDRSAMETAVDAGYYVLNASRDVVCFSSAVIAHQVAVTYSAGYGDAEDVPSAIRQGLLIHLSTLYHDRLNGAVVPASAQALYQPYRMVRL